MSYINISDLLRLLLGKVFSSNEKLRYKIIRALLFSLRSHLFDMWYKTITLTNLMRLIDEYMSWLSENKVVFESEFFDCDDFAITFKTYVSIMEKSNAVGIALGMIKKDDICVPHAWNIAILSTKEVVFIEPQTGEIMFDCTSTDGFRYELMSVVW